MSVVIKGMKMPVQCASCKLFGFMQFKGEIKDVCNAIDRLLENPYQRPDWCPLTEVPDNQWIPFTVRELDEEEKELHPEWDCILDGKLPENGQRILVNVKTRGFYREHESVQMDEYYDDDGCCLDSGYELGTEATHWMPLPEPPLPETLKEKA